MNPQMQFKPAVRRQLKAKVGFMGTAGTGKSWNALALAVMLGERVAAIDSERGRLIAYAGDFKFDHLPLPNDAPESYVQAVELANEQDYDVIVVDSISHEWAGKDGVLASVDRFGGWKVATPRHDEFVDTLFRVPRHVICTMRAKTHYTQTEVEASGGGKRQEVVKLGVGPIQRDNVEYEFDLLGMFDLQHALRVHKSVIGGISTGDLIEPGEDPRYLGRLLADKLLTWINEGEEVPPIEKASEEDIGSLRGLLRREGFAPEKIEEQFRKRRIELGALTPEYVQTQTALAQERLKQRGLLTEQAAQEPQADAEAAGEAAPAAEPSEPSATVDALTAAQEAQAKAEKGDDDAPQDANDGESAKSTPRASSRGK